MALIERSGVAQDTWSRLDEEGTEPSASGDLLLNLDQWIARQPWAGRNGRNGLEIDNDTEVLDLIPHLPHLALIAVRFPSSADGRGFSLARQLRARGFSGELRAVGPLIADQFAFALQCGFDRVEIPESVAGRQPVEQWTNALASIGASYQTGYRGARNILEARHSPART